MMDLSVFINGLPVVTEYVWRLSVHHSGGHLVWKTTRNYGFTRENTRFRIVWDRANHVSLSVQFNLSLHNRRGSPRRAGLGGPGGWPRGGLGAQGGQVLFDTGVADQPSGVLVDQLLTG